MAEHASVMRAFVVLSQTRKNGGYLLRLVFLIFSIYHVSYSVLVLAREVCFQL
jgi:hypothetical protein